MPHIHDLYDFTASGCVVHNGRILLINHKKVGSWLPPGGHVDLNEEPMETLWREMEEEIGLTKDQLKLIELYGDHTYNPPTAGFYSLPLPYDFYVVNYHENDPTHKHIDMMYLLEATTDQVVMAEREAHDIGWFDASQLDKMLTEGKMFVPVHNRVKRALHLMEERTKS